MRRTLSRALLCLLVLAHWPLGVTAQDAPPAAPANAAAPSAAEAPAPQAIDFGAIALRINEDERFVEDVRTLAQARDAVPALTRRLAQVERTVQDKASLFRDTDLTKLPVQRLESLERHWRFDAREYALWRKDADAATTPYAEAAAALARKRADWVLTREGAADAGIPPAIVARIDTLIASATATETALSRPLLAHIALGQRGNRIDVAITAGQKAVAAAIADIDSRILRIDSPPLWAIQGQPSVQEDSLANLEVGLRIEMRFLEQYRAAAPGLQHALSVLQVLFLVGLLWLWWQARRGRIPLTSTPRFAAVLGRPLSAWLLLACAAVLVFEPNAPLILHELALLLALVPVVRMLPPGVRTRYGAWPIVAAGLYLFARGSFLLSADALYYRSYLLLTACIGATLTLWMLARTRRQPRPGFGDRVLRKGAWVAVALFVVAIIANVVGNLSLAETLANGVIDGGYIAIALYSTVNVTTTLLLVGAHYAKGSGVPLLARVVGGMADRADRWLGVVASFAWAALTLQQFRLFRPLYEGTAAVLGHAFTFGELSISLGNIAVFIIAVAIAFVSARTVRYLLREEVLPNMALPRGVDNSIASLSYYALLMVGFLLALSAAGFKVGQLAVVFGALGVGIGLGLQGVVTNFVSGLILMFERPIQPGDVIDIGGTNGRVRDIGMRSTTVSTFEGADVVVPNGMLIAEKLTNWTLLNRMRRLEVPVGVAYGSDAARAMALMVDVARGTPGVAETPAPVVLFTAMGASALEFSVRAWTHEYDDAVLVRSALVERLHAALVEGGFEIPFPQQDVHVRTLPEGMRTPGDASDDNGDPAHA